LSITIQQTVWGFQVAIVSRDGAELARAVESLKLTIPKTNRRFQPAGKYWFIDRRAEKKLRKWLGEVAGSGEGTVREFDREKRPVLVEAA
jgi:hypothetical protein